MTKAEKKKIRIISDDYMTDFYLDGKKIKGLQEIEFHQRLDEVPSLKLRLVIVPGLANIESENEK